MKSMSKIQLRSVPYVLQEIILVSEAFSATVGLHVHESSETNITRQNESPHRG